MERQAADADLFIAAWGVLPAKAPKERAQTVLDMLTRQADVHRLGEPTAAGHPRHPLYLPANKNGKAGRPGRIAETGNVSRLCHQAGRQLAPAGSWATPIRTHGAFHGALDHCPLSRIPYISKYAAPGPSG